MNAIIVRAAHSRLPFFSMGVVRPTAFALVFLLLTAFVPPALAQQVDAAPVVVDVPSVEQPVAPIIEEPAPPEVPPVEVAPTPPVNETKTVDETPVEEKPVDGAKQPPTPQTALSSSSFDQTTSDLANQKDIAKSNVKNDQATGSLRYTYPFELPKGRNGLTPDLGLKYNSQDLKNGIVGFAWQLSIPYIERLNKNGTDTMYADNTFSSSEQGELSFISGTTYRPRVTETDFIKYDLQSNAWIATTKDGTKYFYGTAASSRVDNPSDTSKVYRWMLDEVRDTNGNSIFYTYTKNSNQIYPDTISYTKNGSETAPYQVAFSYVTNTTTSSYVSGFLVETSKRLSEVAVSFNSSWVKKYALSYTQDSLNQRNRLTSISLQGKDDAGATITYPSTTFEYQQALPSGQNALVSDTVTDRFPVATYGAVFVDVNGDGLVDMVKSSCTNCAYSSIAIDQKVYLNDGAKLVYSSAWSLPTGVYFYADNIDQGYRFADVNGDLKPDIVYRTNIAPAAVYLNTGSGWTLNSSWTVPHLLFSMNPPATTGQHFIDYTADGYIDSLIFYWVSGNSTPVGWKAKNNTDGSWTDVPYYPGNPNDFIPIVTNPGVYTSDVNGDGLADLIQSYNGSSGGVKKIALNTGAGNGFAESAAIDMSSIGYFDPGAYSSAADIWFFGDVNNDGLDDAFLPHNGSMSSTQILGLNTFTGTTGITWQMTPHPYVGSGGTQFVDINGDGALDSVLAYTSAGCGSTCLTNNNVINQAKNPELLTKINYPEGGNTVITYTRTNQPVSGVLKNPLLATPLNVVSSITTSDGSSTAASASYAYEGGEIWNQSDPHDRKFAGFTTVTETTPTTVTKTYYHQGNSSDSSHGEYSDEMWKIGKPYRIEQYDTSSHLYGKTINKWDSYALGSSNAKFVKLTQSVDSTYDGDSSHKDTAVTYTYDNATGNVTQKVEYGQVTGSDDGTFTDTGTDDFTTTASFTNNTTDNIFLPYTVTVTDHGASKVKEDRYYYDTQSLGSVTKGNETKHEQWKAGTTYINSQKTYNSTYGLVATSTDPRGKVTTYTYDSYNLYPATVTDPLTHATSYTYDYSSGKVKQITDVNGLVYQTVYDALDRPIEEKQPDQTTPSTLVTKTTYAYTDTSGSVSVHKVDFLDSTTSVDSYTYFDGLHRPVQTRTEMEDANTFAVTDTIYNSTGQVDKRSVPYSATGSSKASPTTTIALLAAYAYDPLGRVTSMADAAGTITTSYNDWKTTVTDRRGKTKDTYQDAYGNLVQVDEHNGASTYSTYYEYNGNGNLTKITDALGNVRNFTYDGLGRRLTAQDLHASSDTYYGSWSYTYDDAGNLTQTIDPKAQTVNYTYDDVNRKLTEDYTGHTGTEVLYTYDTCTRGIGKLCESEVVGTTLSDYQYSPTGQPSQEYENTNNIGFTTTYTYDRQGNKLEITNPDSSKVKYTYNTAGQLETIQRKESTDGSYANVATDFDYGPDGKVTYQANQNGTTTTNTYDASKLYRLSSKVTTASGGASTIALVQSKIDNANSSISFNSTPTVGNLVVVVVARYPTVPSPTEVTDNKGNTYTRAVVASSPAGSPNDSVAIYYAKNISSSGTFTVSYAGGGTISILEYSGADTTAPLDLTSGGTGNSTTPDSGSVTTTGNGKLFIGAAWSNRDGDAWAANNGFTLRQSETNNSFRERLAVADKVGNAQTTSARFTVTSSDTWAAVVATFKPATTASSNAQNLAYTYDANGNITKIVDASNTNSAKTVDYTYDDLNRLLTATTSNPASGQTNYTHTFTYDALGNMLSGPAGSYTYGGNIGTSLANPHATTAVGTATYGYDANGNMISKASSTAPAWYSTGGTWTTRKQVTIDHTKVSGTGSLSNFTVLVSLTDADLKTTANGGHVGKTDGTDILFTASDGTTKLSHEIEKYDGTTGNLVAWVKVPTLSTSTDTVLILYYGNSSATDQQDKVNTWDSSYKLVQHLPNGTTLSAGDSTSNANNGTVTGATATTGKVAGGANFSGSTSSYVQVPNSASLQLNSQVTVSAWVYKTQASFPSYAGFVVKGPANWNGLNYMLQTVSGTSLVQLTYAHAANNNDYLNSASSLAQNAWTYVVGVVDTVNGTQKIYLNGSQDASRTVSTEAITTTTDPLWLGKRYDSGFTGKLDEVHVSNTARSASWIATEYNNQSSPSTFLTLGSVSGGSMTDSYTYDFRNTLTQTTTGGNTYSYGYDYAKQRVQYQTPSGITVYPTKYYNSGGTTIQKHILDAQGNTIATVTGTGATATIYYDHTDHLTGSNVVTNSAGTLEELLDYYPYGDIRLDQKVGSYSEQNKFAGHEYDVDTGLNYAVSRYYNSAFGRWTSQDPAFLALGDDSKTESITQLNTEAYLMDPQALNSYSYARNNPLMYVDIDGNYPSWGAFKNYRTTALKLAKDYVVHQAKEGWQNYMEFREASYQWQMEHPKATEALVNLAVIAGGTTSSKGPKVNVPNPKSIKFAPGKVGDPLKNAQQHWTKHQADFPQFKNEVEYANYANNFVNSPSKGVMIRNLSGGRTAVYDPSTNTLGFKQSGTPTSLYKPDPAVHGHKTNLEYFNSLK